MAKVSFLPFAVCRKRHAKPLYCLETIGVITAPWKFVVLKTSIFALEASLLEEILVLEHQISAGQPSADSSSQSISS